MPSDPQAPDGGYALTPDRDSNRAETSQDPASTAHHEELLRTEALAARRGNRAVARFAVVGLIAALVVGIVTWRSSVPSKDKVQSSEVVDASADSELSSSPTTVPHTPATRTPPGSAMALPAPGATGGLAQLSEDPYLPPNSWNGGGSLVPAPDVDRGPTRTPQDSVPPQTGNPDRGFLLPTIPDLPTLPPIPPQSSDRDTVYSTTTTPTDPTDPAKPTEPTEPTEPTGPSTQPDPAAESDPASVRGTGHPSPQSGKITDSPTRTTARR